MSHKNNNKTNKPGEWLISASPRVWLLSTFCTCQSSAGCLPCASVFVTQHMWVRSSLTAQLSSYKSHTSNTSYWTYRVLGAARHDVLEFDFWHIVVVTDDRQAKSWSITPLISHINQTARASPRSDRERLTSHKTHPVSLHWKWFNPESLISYWSDNMLAC